MHALLATAASALALGCVHRFPATIALDDPVLEREWRASLFVPPAATRSQQRVVFARGGTELDFSVLVQAHAPDSLRIVGLTDLGGTLFHVLREGGTTQVIQGSPFLDDDFLAHTLVAGLAPLFLVPDGELDLVRTDAGVTALHARLGAGEVLFSREHDGGAPDRIETGQDGCSGATLQVLEWSRDADGRILAPSRFTLRDAAGECRLDFLVLAWRAENAS